MLSGIDIEAFRGDLEGLEKMAHSAWRDEYGIESFPNLYRPKFLRFVFDRIEDKNHLIAAYRGDEIVSFMANLPRRFSIEGKIYTGVYTCLLVTRKELLRQGIANALIREALELNKKARYDLSIFALEKGHRSTQLVKKLEATGNPVQWLKRNGVIARVLDLKRAAASEGLKTWEKTAIRIIGAQKSPKKRGSIPFREYRPKDLARCQTLLNQYTDKIKLALVWDSEELGVELDYPDVSQTVVYEKDGKVEGLINFIYHDHLGKTKERWAWINHVAYPALYPRERRRFVEAFLCYVQDTGCLGAVEWTRKYYPMEPLYRNRFFPYFRYVNMVAWTFNQDISLRKIPAVYEVQI
ncbi:MAG: GNAT family N-acetyltransferase [Candidatus Aminicenantes bacterium]|nr:MAG: GNAT family N-acetyltransferase [Candidatus Aminicenantes bacterium]